MMRGDARKRLQEADCVRMIVHPSGAAAQARCEAPTCRWISDLGPVDAVEQAARDHTAMHRVGGVQ